MEGKEGSMLLHRKDLSLQTSPEVEHEVERRRIAGETVSNQPDVKIENFLKVIERTHLGHREDSLVLDRIKKYYHKNYVIQESDIPESYFELQKRLARELGYGDIEITNEQKKEMSKTVINDQKQSLDAWTEYFTSPDSDSYPMWAKYWSFTNMLKLSSYDKEKHSFGKRTKGTTTLFPDLNREALAYVVDIIEKKLNKEDIPDAVENQELQKLLQSENFGKLYAYAIDKVTPTEEHELANTAGEWIIYKQGTDHMPLVQSLQGYGTGWCTAGESTAKTQLAGGDFHTYYSYDKEGKPTIPRVAIRMEGNNKIAEVRGIAYKQNIDPYISDVVGKKMTEFGKEGEKYTKKSEDMKRMTEIDKRRKAGEEFTKEDLRFLHEIDSEIKGFGYVKDPRIKELISGRDIKKDISFALDCSEDEISLNSEEFLESLKSKKKIKYHRGDLELNKSTLDEKITFPDIVSGNLNLFSVTSINNVAFPKRVGKTINLRSLTSAKMVIFPESVGGDFWLDSLTVIEEVTFPKEVGGNFLLYKIISAKEIIFPEKIGGTFSLPKLTSAKMVVFPESVGGNVNLFSLISAKMVVFPESVGGNFWLNKLSLIKKKN